MLLANNKDLPLARRAGIVTFIYTKMRTELCLRCEVGPELTRTMIRWLNQSAGTKSESGAAVKQSTSP